MSRAKYWNITVNGYLCGSSLIGAIYSTGWIRIVQIVLLIVCSYTVIKHIPDRAPEEKIEA